MKEKMPLCRTKCLEENRAKAAAVAGAEGKTTGTHEANIPRQAPPDSDPTPNHPIRLPFFFPLPSPSSSSHPKHSSTPTRGGGKGERERERVR